MEFKCIKYIFSLQFDYNHCLLCLPCLHILDDSRYKLTGVYAFMQWGTLPPWLNAMRNSFLTAPTILWWMSHFCLQLNAISLLFYRARVAAECALTVSELCDVHARMHECTCVFAATPPGVAALWGIKTSGLKCSNCWSKTLLSLLSCSSNLPGSPGHSTSASATPVQLW